MVFMGSLCACVSAVIVRLVTVNSWIGIGGRLVRKSRVIYNTENCIVLVRELLSCALGWQCHIMACAIAIYPYTIRCPITCSVQMTLNCAHSAISCERRHPFLASLRHAATLPIASWAVMTNDGALGSSS